MFQKFFTDTIESKFIKSLLRNTPIPTYRSITDNDYVIAGCTYINKYGIVRYLESGIAKDSQFIRLSPYILNLKDRTYTENYISKYNYYDTETHEKLGDYLRLFRNLNEIDLMQYYNCFSYRFFDNIVLNHNAFNGHGYSLEKNTIYKVAAIPIKFDKTYTIAIDSNSPINIKSFLYDSLGFLNKKVETTVTPVVDLLNDCMVYIDDIVTTNSNCQLIPQCSINIPIHYKICTKKSDVQIEDFTDEYKKKLLNLEKYLYLLIQLPVNSSSSITVLEGNYTNKHLNKTFYNIDFESLSSSDNDSEFKTIQDVIDDILASRTDFIRSNIFEQNDYSNSTALTTILSLLNFCNVEDKNRYLSGKLSLLEYDFSTSYAFNDRLIEYLLLNVIDNTDTIDNNVTKVQKTLNITNRLDVIPSVWSDLLRSLLFRNYFSSNLEKKFDISGFVDKDIEKLLIKMDGDF